jgi:hypothetical protein
MSKAIDAYFILAAVIICTTPTIGQERNREGIKFPILTGSYLGQERPGKEPKIFAPGIISLKESNESVICFTNTNNQPWCLFTRFSDEIPDFTAFETKLVNGIWNEPKVSKLFVSEGCYLPCFNYEGTKVFYIPAKSISRYPPEIWCSDLGNTLKPQLICRGMYPSVSKIGTLYYDYDGCIVMRKWDGNGYGEMEYLQESLFLQGDAHPCIAWDDSYLIFDSGDRPGVKDNDMFISFRLNDNKWTKPINMGKHLNMSNSGLAKISPDGEYIFFHSSSNGNTDFYWVDASIIEDIRLSIVD